MKEIEYLKPLLTGLKIYFFRKMRITIILLLISASGAFSNSYSQQTLFSFSLKNKTVKDVIKTIEDNSEFVFLFADNISDELETKVSISAKSININNILDEVFENLPLDYKINDRQVLITQKKAQPVENIPEPAVQDTTKKISGSVKEKSGEPLVGATIILKTDHTKGTVTNANGTFSFNVGKSVKTLIVSFIGMESKEIDLQPGIFEYAIVLEQSVTDLSEVVATGYFNRKKDNFTGSAKTVTLNELKQVNPSNVFQSIESFDPSFKVIENNLLGSDPNRMPNINVRGAASVPSGGNGEIIRRDNIASNVNMPTYILDGYEVSVEKIYDIDMNRIASITLLKDAAATAIYGSRAANGVLVITTVAPEEGKLRVSYNTEFTLSVPDLSSYKILNAADKLEYEKLAGLYDYIGATSQDDLDELFYQKKKNVVSGVDTYWLSQPVKNAFGNKHSLYIDGGSETIRYGVNLQYQNVPGVMLDSKRDRYGLSSDLSYNLNGKILFKNSLSVSRVLAEESPYGSFSEYVRMNPYYPMTDQNGKIVREIDSWTDRSGDNGSEYTEVVLNPLYNGTLSSFHKSNYIEVTDAFSAEWNITKELRLRGLVSYSQKASETDDFTSPLDNEFYFYQTEDLSQRGRYFYSSQHESYIDGNLTATYSKGFKNHFFNIALGTNIRDYHMEGKWFTAIGFTNDRFSNIGFAKSYVEESSPGNSSSTDRLFGAFLSLNYSLKNTYLLDLSIRADGSSKFGSENKVAPFWAMGLGWNLHNEGFLESSEVISTLKLKANTGLTGSVSFSPYMSKTLYDYYKDNWYSTGVGAIVNQYGNENLKWQRTRNYDYGLDLGLLNNRLYFSGRYYNKLTEDMLTDITLPPSTGFNYYKENLGDIKNKGYEINTKLNVLKTKDLSITLNGSFIHNTNKLVKISNSLKELNNKANDAQTSDEYKGVPLIRYNEGQSLNAIYAVRSLGIDPENGKEIYITKDGELSYEWDVKDIVPICDATPNLEGYFGGSIYFKGFLLSCNFYSRFGGYEYNQTLVDRVENADPRYNVDQRVLENRWKTPGDIALYKDISNLESTYVTERFIQKDNVVELKSVYLSYDFSHKMLKPLHLRNLRAAITLNDVWRWSSITIERGIDYPFARSFTFSLQANF